jgi:uncharacterized protein YkwD
MTYYASPVQIDNGTTVTYENENELAHGLMRQWIRSPEHRDNLLSKAESVGHGISITTEDGRIAVYVTQNFCG